MKYYHVEKWSGEEAKFFHVTSCDYKDAACAYACTLSAAAHITRVRMYYLLDRGERTIAAYYDGKLQI